MKDSSSITATDEQLQKVLTQQKIESATSDVTKNKEKIDLSKYESLCSEKTSFQPTSSFNSSSVNAKTIFFPQYPDSFLDSDIRALISSITSIPTLTKSYYASMRRQGLRLCRQANSPTAVCLIVFPIVGDEAPEKFRGKFGDFSAKVFLGIRNPMRVFARFLNGKANRYHGVIGQMTKESWRQSRDGQFDAMLSGWIHLIKTWITMYGYENIVFVPHEEIFFSASSAIDIIQELSLVLHQHDFPTVSKSDLECVWYTSLKASLYQMQQFQYEFSNYTPGFTFMQQDYLIANLTHFREEMKDYPRLYDLLSKYIQEIIQDLVLDDAAALIPNSR